jgi:hypothetical protein
MMNLKKLKNLYKMEAIILSSKQYEAIMNKFNLVEEHIEKMSGFNFRSIVDNDEFVKLMGISKKTAQNWRDNGLVSYSQIGHKIYYSRTDIEQFITNHHVVAFGQIQHHNT